MNKKLLILNITVGLFEKPICIEVAFKLSTKVHVFALTVKEMCLLY